jgi:hypothetical protein
MSHLVCYTIRIKEIENMKDTKETTNFIVTTTNGTRWGATGASFAQIRREFFGKHFGSGMEIESIKRGKLFSDEESEELRKEKIEDSIR